MDSILKNLFGGQNQGQGNDNSHVQQAQNFVSQYEQGGSVPDQAVQRYQQVAQQVSPDVYQQAAEQAFSQMDPSQREQFLQLARQQMGNQGVVSGQTADPRQLAQLATQIHQQQPGGLAALFGGGQSSQSSQSSQGSQGGGLSGVLSNPLAKMVLGGIAAMAVKNVLDQHGSGTGSSSSSSGLTI